MFTLICNDNGVLTNVNAEPHGRAIAITIGNGGTIPARNLNEATRKAAN